MRKLDPNNTGGKDERDGTAGDGVTGRGVAHTPGGPGWVSQHSQILWIAGIVLAITAFITYMIIDN
jgi:hypothetical protein